MLNIKILQKKDRQIKVCFKKQSPIVSFFFLCFFNKQGVFLDIFMNYIQHCFICHPSDSTVSEDAGIEPRTVATLALAVGRSNHSARSHPHPQFYIFLSCIAFTLFLNFLVFYLQYGITKVKIICTFTNTLLLCSL
jgi:hypothetical protein